MDENEIDSTNELDLEEYQCKSDVLLLNENKDIYIPINANIQMRLRYYNKAKETKAKDHAITALKYMANRQLGKQANVGGETQPVQPQMQGGFPGQDQQQGQAPQPTAKQPKIENPVTAAQAEKKMLSVNGMDSVQ